MPISQGDDERSTLTSRNSYMDSKINSLYFELPAAPFKKEAQFTTWFLWQIRKNWGFAHKISDYSPNAKPWDAIISYNGMTALVELKKVNSATCHPYQLLRWSWPKNPGTQVESLGLFARNGWISLIIVYSCKVNRYAVLDFGSLDFITKISIDEVKN